MRTLVTGANRGIGLELVRQLRERGDDVEACAQSPKNAHELQKLAGDRVRIHALDVTDTDSVRWLAGALGDVALDRRGRVKKFVHLTSGMGSISDNTSGGSYAYRMSKAALNMMSRSLARDLAGEGIASYVINPGWVQTDMGGSGAPTPVADSVRGILREVDKATLADSGEFLNWKGNRYAW